MRRCGDLFGKTFAALLKMYTFYANNYMQALTLYGDISRNHQKYIEFTQQVQADGATCDLIYMLAIDRP